MKKQFTGIIICMLTVCLCILSNMIAPLIDNKSLRNHATEAVDSVWNAGASRQVVGGFETARLDDYTTVLIVKIACFTGNASYLNKVFGGLRIEQAVRGNTDDWGAYCTYVSEDTMADGDIIQSYTRYWHGYILPLRLAMSLMSFNNVIMLCYLAEIILFAIILVLGAQREIVRKAIPCFVLTFFLLMPAAMAMCVNYIPCMLISLAACVFVLCVGEKVDQKIGIKWFFAIIGILTSFMDLLTFPVLTLVVPMTFWLCIMIECGQNLKKTIQIALITVMGWGLGYAGMWALKWIINWGLYGPDFINGVFQQILLRSSTNADGVDFSRLDSIRAAIHIILDKPAYKLALGGYLFVRMLFLVKEWYKGNKRFRNTVFCFLFPVAGSLLWIMLTTNHVIIHCYYVYRSLWVALFPLLAMFACAFYKESSR